MAKKRTLSITSFLNDKLKPVKEETGFRGKIIKYYPLYYRVTYNREGTMIKSRFEDSYKEIEDVPKRILEEEESLLRSIVEYETDGLIGDFDLKKLKNKYETYSKGVHICLDEHIRSRVKRILGRINNNPVINIINIGKYAPNNQAETLVKVCQQLIPNFNKIAGDEFAEDFKAYQIYMDTFNIIRLTYTPTVTNWLSDATQIEMKEKLRSKGLLVRDIMPIINTITHILEDSIR
ncbi:hypothetical protein [Emticicia agri]|uniref:Uncharacterized protein n=1 Tax=Emticicia agri TaxID=2492393 RepID=A0A4Q5LY76_9BACT|nr:hypothetical protein [Emticicia agri]RYU94748.1 hypothetical protein EWM59_15565 [Emticicia agri]